MVAVAWDPALALGHTEIDGQHQEIFRRFAALVAAMEVGQPTEIGLLFDFLGEYAAKHFAAEEQVMAASRYPGANVHACAHARFVREFGELRALYEANGPSSGIAVKTRIWIEDWLRSHIMGVDQVLARFLKGG
jgi:hemerythrin